MRDFAAQTGAILWKDLLLEARSRDIFTGMFVFALVVLVLFNFAFDLHLEHIESVAPGIIWITVLMMRASMERLYISKKGSIIAVIICALAGIGIVLVVFGVQWLIWNKAIGGQTIEPDLAPAVPNP